MGYERIDSDPSPGWTSRWSDDGPGRKEYVAAYIQQGDYHDAAANMEWGDLYRIDVDSVARLQPCLGDHGLRLIEDGDRWLVVTTAEALEASDEA